MPNDELTLVREYLIRRARRIKEDADLCDTRAGKAACLIAHDVLMRAAAREVTMRMIDITMAGR